MNLTITKVLRVWKESPADLFPQLRDLEKCSTEEQTTKKVSPLHQVSKKY